VELKESIRTVDELEERNKELMRTISAQEESMDAFEEKVNEWSNKWKWAFSILAGDA
jgi:predicted RNase H-like nuclease (RuvC/YqgF family)